MKSLALIVPFLMALPLMAEDANPVLTRYIEDGKKQKESDELGSAWHIKELTASIAALKTAKPEIGAIGQNDKKARWEIQHEKKDGAMQVKKRIYHYSDEKEKAAELSKLQAAIKEYESTIEDLKKVEYVTPRLDASELKIGQIGVILLDGKPWTPRVFQVLDEGNVLIKWQNRLIWLAMNTKGMVDDKVYAIKPVFHVKGTKRYEAVLGTKTVLYLEAFNPPK